MKAQALEDHLAENLVDNEYQPLSIYFMDEKENSVETTSEDTHAWKMFFDGAVNAKGIGIGAILVSPIGQHYLAIAQLRFFCANNTAEYEACIMGMNMEIDQDVKELLIMGDSDLIIRQAQGEWETRYVKLIPYRQHVEDLSRWFKLVEFRYIPHCHNKLADALATLASMLPYPGNAHIDPLEIQIRERHCYYNTVEVHDDLIHAPPMELHPMSPWLFVAWSMDVIGPIETKASNGHRFMLVAIDYFTKGVKAITLKSVTKKVMVDFVHSNLIRCFGIPATIIIDNAANLNSHLMREIFGATSYLLVYGTEAVITAEVEIPSLRIIVEAEIEDTEWVKTHLEQLTLIDEK
ncbi:uncharacterized protein [Nicotiana sylvestris]|uniref:uncharacterized protein n=1 Tax=Nicotiana sylvestris TaxID=4096 RepID=UPI00388CE5BF